MGSDPSLTVSEFVALVNQTLEYAYSNVTITGELANFRVSKNRWVYFDLKDDESSVKCFGTVYQLQGPLEDGMMLAVKGTPRLHPLYGFSINILSIQPVGEGSIKKAAALLQAKLTAEGLFDPERKRTLVYPPACIGLIASAESAAYRDFMKILNERWSGVSVNFIDVQVQGEAAPVQIVGAVSQFNQLPEPPDVLVITRGGGSAEDMQAFSTEQVTRAVASSRIPTLVAIGHEVDTCLAELAADRRASTPSNAAELLVPDRKAVLSQLESTKTHLASAAGHVFARAKSRLETFTDELHSGVQRKIEAAAQRLESRRELLEAFNPDQALRRGYAFVRSGEQLVRSGKSLKIGDEIQTSFADSQILSKVTQIKMERVNGRK